MNILCIIYASQTENVIAFDKSYKSLLEVKVNWKVGDRVALYIKAPSDKYVIVDFMLMAQEVLAIHNCTSWDELELVLDSVLLSNYLTSITIPNMMYTSTDDDIIKTIKSPISSHPSDSIYVHACEKHNNILVSYGTIKNRELDNKSYIKWMLPEVIFEHKDINKKVVNFNNCIPVVNGIAHMPIVNNNRLYALGATKSLYSTSDKSKGLLLLDFSPLGNIDIIKLNQCTVIDSIPGFNIKLPNNVDLSKKSVMAVVAGRLLFPNEINRVSKNVISLDINNIGLTSITVDTSIKRSQNVFNTSTYITKPYDIDICFIQDIEDYLKTKLDDREIKEEDVQKLLHIHQDTYLIIIDNENVKINTVEPILQVVKNMLFFNINTNGLLIRKSTREIIDYVKVNYDSITLTTYNHPGNIYRLPIDNPENITNYVGYTRMLPKRYNLGIDLTISDYLIVDITDI